MDSVMLDELERAWQELDEDPGVRVIVNTGRGRSFQSGLDVVELARNPEALREQSRRTKRAELRITGWHNGVSKPVIAAVNGVCAGGGLHFVADADIVLASSDATFLDPHVSIGQVSAYEMVGLARRMPFEAVMRMALIGRHERISAARAFELGMVSQVVDPPEALVEIAQALAETIARNSPAAMRATKRAMWGALEAGLTDACKAGGRRAGRHVGPPRSGGGAARLRREAGARVDGRTVHRYPGADGHAGAHGHPAAHGQPGAHTAMNYSHYDTLIVERRGPVGWLVNNRPDRLNAMNAHMRDEFALAWRELDADPDVRVIVHTGEGRAFQTGVDVAEIASDGVGMERYRQAVIDNDQHFTAWQQQVWKPVITAVNGICAGGGFHWVAEADIVIAASDAEFFDPHVSVGQVVAMEAIGLARRIPFEAVMRMAFLGRYERVSAERAYQLGMISQIVDPPETSARRGAGVGRDHRPQLARRHARHRSARCGRRSRPD